MLFDSPRAMALTYVGAMLALGVFIVNGDDVLLAAGATGALGAVAGAHEIRMPADGADDLSIGLLGADLAAKVDLKRRVHADEPFKAM